MATPVLTPKSLEEFQALEMEGDRQDAVATILLDHLLGEEWRPRRTFKRANANEFLRFTSEPEKIRQVRADLSILAENLWNLSNANIDGWKQFLRLCKADMSEGRYTEVNMAVHLYRLGIPFGFHIGGENTYDFDVALESGQLVATEVKTRLRDAVFDKENVVRKLKKAARTQLPSGRPGAMFLEMPHSWGTLPLGTFDEALDEFFRAYSRVVSVTIYVRRPKLHLGYSLFEAAHREVISPHHKFGWDADWRIFGDAVMGKYAANMNRWETLANLSQFYMDGQPTGWVPDDKRQIFAI